MAFLSKKKRRSTCRTYHAMARQQFLLGQMAARQIRGIDRLSRLSDVEFSASSQWGEDGIIEWLIHHLGDVPESFIEFGVEDYRESNTRFLLQNRNWRGLVIDGSTAHIETIKSDALCWRHDLMARNAFVDRDNINQLFKEAGFSGEIGLLSIDIDGNDYWVWEAITLVQPVLVVIETNAVFGDLAAVTVPYRKDFQRTKAHLSNLYFGASPKALEYLAEQKGYQLLGTNTNGSNAFFIRNDVSDRIVPKVKDRSFQPSRIRESRNAEGALSYLSGPLRTEEIAHMEVVDVRSRETAPLKTFAPLFSDAWIHRLGQSTPS
ncbi:MAG: hypothetical protein AAF601_03490 [Pseudomonadota bacterium]